MAEIPVLPMEAYPARVAVPLRYSDTDRQGHVNNAVYATFFEIGRVEFLSDPERPITPEGAQFVIVKLTIEFRRELLWPGIVDIGSGITRIGGKSVALRQAVYARGEAVAAADSVLAIMDDETRRAVPIPEQMRARLGRWAMPEGG